MSTPRRGRPRTVEAGVPILVRVPEPEAGWLRALAEHEAIGLATAARSVLVQAVRERRARARAAAPAAT
jgi:hypothetical protein